MDEPPLQISDAHPPVATSTLVNWLRANLALGTFVLGIAVAGGGSLIGFGSWTTDYRNEQEKQKDTNKAIFLRHDDFQKTFVDVDRRLNEAATARYSDRQAAERADYQSRQALEREIADLRGEVEVLKSQLRLFVDHLPLPAIGRVRQ